MSSLLLVVDDHEDTRDALKLLLECYGYEVLVAADGHQALEILAERLSAIIITDLMMPGMDGVALCRTLQRDPAKAFRS